MNYQSYLDSQTLGYIKWINSFKKCAEKYYHMSPTDVIDEDIEDPELLHNIGDRVVLLKDTTWFKTGDIGTIIRFNMAGYNIKMDKKSVVDTEIEQIYNDGDIRLLGEKG